MKKAGFFYHMDANLSAKEKELGFAEQVRLLDEYAEQQGYALEHGSFHEGEVSLDDPDRVLRLYLEAVQAGEIDITLVTTREHFPLSNPDRLPSMDIHILDEDVDIRVGKDTEAFQRVEEPVGPVYGYIRTARPEDAD